MMKPIIWPSRQHFDPGRRWLFWSPRGPLGTVIGHLLWLRIEPRRRWRMWLPRTLSAESLPLVGNATLAITASGTLTVGTMMAAAATLRLIATASLTTAISLAGTSTLRLAASGSLLAPSQLAGGATLRLTAQGTLSAAAHLSASITLSLLASARLTAGFIEDNRPQLRYRPRWLVDLTIGASVEHMSSEDLEVPV